MLLTGSAPDFPSQPVVNASARGAPIKPRAASARMPAGIAEVLNRYPEALRSRLILLRQLVLDTADGLEGVGPIEEALKWGQPSFLTSATGTGSTIRIAPAGPKSGHDYGMYFICSTDLVSSFQTMFGDLFNYEGNRALLFDLNDALPTDELSVCISMALTYHLNK